MRSRSLLSAPFRFLPHFKCAQSRCDGKMTRGGRHNAPDLAHNHLGLCVLPASTYLQTLFLLPGCSQPLGCVLLAYNQVEARPFLTTLDFRPANSPPLHIPPAHLIHTHSTHNQHPTTPHLPSTFTPPSTAARAGHIEAIARSQLQPCLSLGSLFYVHGSGCEAEGRG